MTGQGADCKAVLAGHVLVADHGVEHGFLNRFHHGLEQRIQFAIGKRVEMTDAG